MRTGTLMVEGGATAERRPSDVAHQRLALNEPAISLQVPVGRGEQAMPAPLRHVAGPPDGVAEATAASAGPAKGVSRSDAGLLQLHLQGRNEPGLVGRPVQRGLRVGAGDLSGGADVLAIGSDPTERPAAAAVDQAPMPTEAQRGAMPASVTGQIAEAFRASAADGGREVVLQLNPPELGKVRIVLKATGREVDGVVAVENSRTLLELRQEAPILLERLAEAGVHLRRMEMNLTDSSGGRDLSSGWQSPGEGGARQEWTGQNAPAAVGADPVGNSQSGADETLAGAHRVGTSAGEMTEGTVNVWR